MSFLIRIGVIVIGTAVLLFFLAILVVDMAGRVDYVQSHFPRLVKWAEHKRWHGILLLTVALLLTGNLYEITHGDEPLKVKLTVGTADDGAKNAQIEKLRSQLNACRSRNGEASKTEASVTLLHDLKPLGGQTIVGMTPEMPSVVQIANLSAKNDGSKPTFPIHVRLYLSGKLLSHMPGIWIETESDDPNFQSEFFLVTAANAVIHSGEGFNFEPAFSGTLASPTLELRAKLKCFYGASSPAVANFSVVQGPK